MSPWFSDLFLSSQSDERLVKLARTGHQQAFTAIVSRYRRELTRFANRLGPEGKAEDVVQQTFLSALTALQNDSEVKHLRGWLYAILRHHAARVGARGALDTGLTDVDPAGIPLEEAVSQRMTALEALSEIGRLPDNQRAALLATALEGRSRAEIASLLGVSEGAVRQLVHRARSTVRAAVTAITPLPVLRWMTVKGRTAPVPPAELVAGAGGAGTGAVLLKVGAVVVAGLGVAGVAGLRPRLGRRATPTVRIAPAVRGPGTTGSAPALAGFVAPSVAGTAVASAGEPGTASAGPRRGAGSRDGSSSSSHGDRGGGSDGAGRSGDSGHSGSGDGGHDGVSGSPGSGDSGGSSGSSDGGSTRSGGPDGSSGSSGGTTGGGSGSDGGSSSTPGSSGSGSAGGGGPDGGGGSSGFMTDGGGTSGGDTTTITTSGG